MRILFVLFAAIFAVLLGLAFAPHPGAADGRSAVMYKNPECSCCSAYADYLRGASYRVEVKETAKLETLKRTAGVPDHLASCHTMMIDGYVIEGHVPLAAIEKLLEERPRIRGISLPGMPLGSPGMNGPKEGPFKVYEIGQGAPRLYSVE